MPLPENFNSWEHLQSTLIRTYNKEVREAFREDVDETDLVSPEGTLKQACLITDNDSAIICNIRMMFFYNVCGNFFKRIRDEGYYTPKIDFHENYRFKPQVQLKFQESYQDAKKFKRKDPKRIRFTYRLLNLTSETITQSDITQIKNKINTLFPESWEHYAGLNYYDFFDSEQYDKHIRIPARNKTDANGFLSKLCNLIGINYNPDRVTPSDPPIKKKITKKILGENKVIGSNNPTGHIKLKQAVISLHGNLEDVLLVSRLF